MTENIETNAIEAFNKTLDSFKHFIFSLSSSMRYPLQDEVESNFKQLKDELNKLEEENQSLKCTIARLESELSSEKRQSGLFYRQASHSEELIDELLLK